LNAGRKCSGLISWNGGTPNGVVHSFKSGLLEAAGGWALSNPIKRKEKTAVSKTKNSIRRIMTSFSKGILIIYPSNIGIPA
jgi:hypothetical protein